MKLNIYLALILCICIAYVQARRGGRGGRSRCRGQPSRQDCTSRFDAGRGGFRCRKAKMWFFENGQCVSKEYKGCGGNGNRYCKKADCETKCRPTTTARPTPLPG